MKKTAAKKVSFDSYIAAAKPRKALRCETCRTSTPEMLADIKRLAEMRKAGELALSLPQVFEECNVDFQLGVDGGVTQLTFARGNVDFAFTVDGILEPGLPDTYIPPRLAPGGELRRWPRSEPTFWQ